ncbi:metalloregulator ArsR/SmtB family transcription factor [Phenylobacterium sp.]|uniref:ArsR/SmtB family transcription factor n=1 Tax=Phenylobacterium sp. TaxID=1871053 RepID=UPI00286E555A|nr:metalloregulator ArsR/SmtB family transcription factor [Phenylobacterium sp.]
MRNFYFKQMTTTVTDRPSSAGLSELEESAEAATRLLKLLASEQRLLLLCRLVKGEASVGVLAEHAKLAQSAASQHLAKMRAEGLVATRREAQTIYYRLENPAVMRILDALSDVYCGGTTSAAKGAGC